MSPAVNPEPPKRSVSNSMTLTMSSAVCRGVLGEDPHRLVLVLPDVLVVQRLLHDVRMFVAERLGGRDQERTGDLRLFLELLGLHDHLAVASPHDVGHAGLPTDHRIDLVAGRRHRRRQAVLHMIVPPVDASAKPSPIYCPRLASALGPKLWSMSFSGSGIALTDPFFKR